MKRIIMTVLLISLVGACATHPDKMEATPMSYLVFEAYNCTQIKDESDELSKQLEVLYNDLRVKSVNDDTQMLAGLFLAWPVLFFLEGGDGIEAEEYSRLKGQKEALDEVYKSKDCEKTSPDNLDGN